MIFNLPIKFHPNGTTLLRTTTAGLKQQKRLITKDDITSKQSDIFGYVLHR